MIKSGNTISVKSKTVQISHYDSLLKEREALKANLNSVSVHQCIYIANNDNVMKSKSNIKTHIKRQKNTAQIKQDITSI